MYASNNTSQVYEAKFDGNNGRKRKIYNYSYIFNIISL